MTLSKRGFTLVELLVVIAMIAVISAAFTTAVGGAQERAKIQKALGEVKVVTQAVLAYENYDQGGGRHELPLLNKQDVNKSSIGFILGAGGGSLLFMRFGPNVFLLAPLALFSVVLALRRWESAASSPERG